MVTLVLQGGTVLGGCALAMPVQDAHLSTPATAMQPAKVLQREVTVRLSSGYERKLATGSHWRPTGSLAQGEVLRPVDGIFTIEGRHVHEAYLVVSGTNLVGFYLPGEEHFSPLDSPVSLTFGEP